MSQLSTLPSLLQSRHQVRIYLSFGFRAGMLSSNIRASSLLLDSWLFQKRRLVISYSRLNQCSWQALSSCCSYPTFIYLLPPKTLMSSLGQYFSYPVVTFSHSFQILILPLTKVDQKKGICRSQGSMLLVSCCSFLAYGDSI